MARTAINKSVHSDDLGKIDQKADIVGDVALKDRGGEIVEADPALLKKAYLDELAFNEEPVTIRLEPSTDKNSPTAYPAWNNGKGAEIFENGRWREVGWLPVNRDLIVKRKTVATLISTKIDTVETVVTENPNQDPDNRVRRFTSPVHSLSIINDSARGHAWMSEIRRRNF